MKQIVRKIVLAAFVGTLALSTSGCLILLLGGFDLLGYVSESGDGSIRAMATVNPCLPLLENVHSGSAASSPSNGQEEFYCQFDADGIDPINVFILFFFGDISFTGNPFLDPLLLQYPTSVSNIAGTYDDGGSQSGNLMVQQDLTCVPTGPGQQICAEPGHKLAILDLPMGVFGTFEFAITFDVNPAQPVALKALLTGKVVTPGPTFYPIVAPCVTSFADAPEATIPVSDGEQGIDIAFGDVEVCETIDFTAAVDAPAAGRYTLVLIVGLLLVGEVGRRMVRRRRAI